jgi:Fe-S cluster biogenesis protein NfuA
MNKPPLEVYAESTPNPAAMKFVVNRMLLAGGVVEYFNARDAAVCPLAVQLFSFPDVKAVFLTANFVTVTKSTGSDWFDLMPILREAVRGFFLTGEPLFRDDPNAHQAAEPGVAPAPGVESRIIELLEEYVRPAVEQDGGAIHFKSYHDGVVTLLLKGSCSGCPSSMVTLKGGIENLLRKSIPEVKEVVAEEA